MYDKPLSQRKTGRRARKRMERESNDDTTNSFDTSAATIQRLAPDPEIQQQIEAAILERSKYGTDGRVFPHNQDSTEVDNDTVNSFNETLMISSGYEYLDHTADVQLHAWGKTFSDTISQIALAMFGYMTTLSTVDVDTSFSKEVACEITANGHDMKSLVFSFLDEWLFIFHTTGFLAKKIDIIKFDRESYSITSCGLGEKMNLNKHPQGTEVKAITHSNLHVQEKDGKCDIWVIIDI